MEIKLAYDDTRNILALFSEYIDMLLGLEPDFQCYLEIQDYDSEIEDLTQKYGLPSGRLYIAYYEGNVAGCIALRQMNDEECEMKRLYVKPQFRGNGIAKELVRLIVNDAKEIGYKSMLLDTWPSLNAAIKLYEGFGFYRIPPYNDSPIANTVYLKLDL